MRRQYAHIYTYIYILSFLVLEQVLVRQVEPASILIYFKTYERKPLCDFNRLIWLKIYTYIYMYIYLAQHTNIYFY